MTFTELPIPASLQKALADHSYGTPTPVQTLVMEERCKGRDLLVSARTGSGKTIAFGLAFGESIIAEDGSIPPPGAPLALVIAPTRELALQVQKELAWLYAPTLAHVRSCVGGMDVRREAFQLAEGAHVVVGTPGRLCDHLARGRLDLSRIRTMVLDEADEMLDMGFREELETLLAACPEHKRTLLFSATIPRGIEEMAAKYQSEPLRVAADPPREAHADIEYRACLIAPRERDLAVVNLLRQHDAKSALVFCATREAVSRLQANLSERGFMTTAISGELTQPERSRALKMLRDGHARVLVATDVAARGLDLPDLELVIHADPPRDAQVLQHRSGRTGRAGHKGVSVLLVPWRLRSQAERMFRQSGIPMRWFPVPTLDEIHALDRERLGQEVIRMCGAVGQEELEIAQMLLEELSPDQLAAALVRQCYAKLPVAEDLPETHAIDAKTGRLTRLGRFKHPITPPRPRPTGTVPQGDMTASESGEEERRGRFGARRFEADREPGIPFRISVGRRQGADPRWLIPLICKCGGIQKRDIGRIDILSGETRFFVSEEAAPVFAAAAAQNVPQGRDAGIRIEPLTTAEAFGTRVPREKLSGRQGMGQRTPAASDRDPRKEGGAGYVRRRATEADPEAAPPPRPHSRGVDFSEERRRTSKERRAGLEGILRSADFGGLRKRGSRPSDRFDPPPPPSRKRFPGITNDKRRNGRHRG